MDRIIVMMILLILSLNCGAETRTFTIYENKKATKVQFEWDEKKRIGVSANHCRPVDENSCEALKKLKSAALSSIKEDKNFGTANPGTLICKKIGGEVVMGYDQEQNENSFCRFSDSSLVDSGSLTWFGRLK
jgi:putative hemolysin